MYYFFVPVVALMAANIVLFVLTSLIINGYKGCWTGRCGAPFDVYILASFDHTLYQVE